MFADSLQNTNPSPPFQHQFLFENSPRRPALWDRRQLRKDARLMDVQPTPFTRVPLSVALRVLECLEFADLANVSATCREWRMLVNASPCYGRAPNTVPLRLLEEDPRFARLSALADGGHFALASPRLRARCAHTLVEVSLNHYDIGQHVEPDYGCLGELHELRVLELQWCRRLRDSDLGHVLQGVPKLSSLKVSACGLLRGTFLRTLPERTPKLLELYLAGLWEVTDAELDAAAGAATGFRQLRALTIKDMRQLSLSTVRTFVLRACPKIVMLDVVRQEAAARRSARVHRGNVDEDKARSLAHPSACASWECRRG